MIILNEAQIRQAAPLTCDVINSMGAVFQSGDAMFTCQPPVQQMMLEPLNGLLCVKSFFSTNSPYFVVKTAGNYRLNDNSVSQSHGMNALYDSQSGQLRAVLADNGYLTQLRTAAAGGYAVDRLAPEQLNIALIVGAGRQARMQLSALLLVRRPNVIRCLGRDWGRLQSLAAWAHDTHQIEVKCYTNEKAALTDVNVVITTTTSRTPVLHKEAVDSEHKRQDLLIVAMGSDSREKRELEEALVLQSDHWVCDDIAQSLILGELKNFSQDEVKNTIRPISLENLSRGALKGLTICDLTGIAKLDLAISEYCLARVQH